MNIRDAAINCEVRKIAYRQTKDGVVVSFVLHPNEVPSELANAHLGTRYMIALVEIGDDDQPKGGDRTEAGRISEQLDTAPRQETKTGGARSWDSMSAAQQAGILCADKAFQKFITEKNGWAWQPNDEQAAQYIRDYCDVQSRSNIDTTPGRRVLWDNLVAGFRTWQQYPELVG